MEYEVRYYFPKSELENITTILKNISELYMDKRRYEKTMQYDHPSDNISFYSKEIDGRFRIRISTSADSAKCKISWKRRINISTEINNEEEVELCVKPEEYDNLLFLVNDVLKMKEIESYERYRTVFNNSEIEIDVDEYPFGIALEIENKGNVGDPQNIIKKWVKILNLDLKKAYKLSWDDKYAELCKEQNVENFKHVNFGLPMPEVPDNNNFLDY